MAVYHCWLVGLLKISGEDLGQSWEKDSNLYQGRIYSITLMGYFLKEFFIGLDRVFCFSRQLRSVHCQVFSRQLFAKR